MNKAPLSACLAVCLSVACFNANAALIGRLELTAGAGDYQAYYDDQLDVTWAATANLVGPLNFSTAKAAVEALSIGGVSGWRLPEMDRNGDAAVVDCKFAEAAACMDNELGFMYWQNNVSSSGPGVFSGVAAAEYWSLDWATWDPNYVNTLNMQSGIQSSSHYQSERMGWAVYSGDVNNALTSVPVPAAAWLLGSGLLALMGVSRSRN